MAGKESGKDEGRKEGRKEGGRKEEGRKEGATMRLKEMMRPDPACSSGCNGDDVPTSDKATPTDENVTQGTMDELGNVMYVMATAHSGLSYASASRIPTARRGNESPRLQHINPTHGVRGRMPNHDCQCTPHWALLSECCALAARRPPVSVD